MFITIYCLQGFTDTIGLSMSLSMIVFKYKNSADWFCDEGVNIFVWKQWLLAFAHDFVKIIFIDGRSCRTEARKTRNNVY